MHIPDLNTLQKASDAPNDPINLFQQWLNDAEKSEECYPNAMCVSTVDPDGKPSARTILLKDVSSDGFVFFTNKESRKSQALTASPYVHLNFYWKSLGRQINIEGLASSVTKQEADDYFQTRPRGSQIGAWASQQSRTLDEKNTFMERIKKYEALYEGQSVPRPPYWSGYRVTPHKIEFWYEGEYRLHTRLLYIQANNEWDKRLLYP